MGISVNGGRGQISRIATRQRDAASSCRMAPSATMHKSTSLSARASPRAWDPNRITRLSGSARSMASRHRANVTRCGLSDAGRFSSKSFIPEILLILHSSYKKASAGVYHYGESSPNTGDNFQLTPALRLIFFPATVGKTVTQRTSFVTSDGSVPATTVTKVVAKGTVIVGAGTFNDSAMVQVKLSMGGSEPRSLILYIWVAPYVGSVAEIQSLDNETNELFTTAFS